MKHMFANMRNIRVEVYERFTAPRSKNRARSSSMRLVRLGPGAGPEIFRENLRSSRLKLLLILRTTVQFFSASEVSPS